MTFTETGSAGFTLTESGTLANGSYTATSYNLGQSFTAFWHFHETTLAGTLVNDSSGTVTLATSSSTSGLVDPYHWYEGAWWDVLMATSGQQALNLASYSWSSFAYSASGNFSWNYSENGTATLN